MSTTMEEIRSALSAVPADARAVWVTMGMALRSELDEAGRDLWMAWSQTSERYREADALAVWRSIRPTGGITIRSLFRAAIDHGWRPTAQGTVAPIIAPPAPHAAPLDWSDRAESIWRRTLPLRGSLAEVYLRHRGCVLPPRDSHLRFLAGTDRYPPSLCAAVTDARSGEPTSIHFTRLAADGNGKAGTEQDKLLLAGHRKKGGCIRLWSDDAVSCGLALAEGVESALAAAHIFQPIWAAIDASNMSGFPVLNGIEALVIFADADDIGIGAAKLCARRWKESGREVRIRRPRMQGTDMADLARGAA